MWFEPEKCGETTDYRPVFPDFRQVLTAEMCKGNPLVRMPRSFSGNGGDFITVGGVEDVRSVVLALPVPAGEGEKKENEGPQDHAAPAEVERKVVGLGVVKEPTWKERRRRNPVRTEGRCGSLQIHDLLKVTCPCLALLWLSNLIFIDCFFFF